MPLIHVSKTFIVIGHQATFMRLQKLSPTGDESDIFEDMIICIKFVIFKYVLLTFNLCGSAGRNTTCNLRHFQVSISQKLFTNSTLTKSSIHDN